MFFFMFFSLHLPHQNITPPYLHQTIHHPIFPSF